MPTWLILAKGPVFRFALAILILGLARLFFLTVWDIAAALRNAGDRQVGFKQIALDTVRWLIPVNRLHKARGLYSYASFIFHLGILFVGLFLGNHIDILRANTGISWWAIGKPLLDALTLAGIIAGGYLLLHRIYVHSSRTLSRPLDYLLLVLLLGIFLSGFLAGQSWNPIPYDGLMLLHTVFGILIFVLIPFTKIAHCILFPLIRLGSEVAWHLTPSGGRDTVRTLYGPEGRKV